VIVVVGALLTTLVMAPQQQAHADDPPPPPQGPPCPAWVVLSAYGADSQPSRDEPFGSPANSQYIDGISRALESKGVRAQDIDKRNVLYPAKLRDRWPWDPDYWDSVDIGQQNMANEVASIDQGCGNRSNVILLGYSMGAHVVKKAMQNPLLQQHQAEVASVVDVADPSRNNGQIGMAQNGQMQTVNPDFSPAQANVQDGGIVGREDVPDTFAGFIDDGRYFDICRTDDTFCNRPGPPNMDDALGLAWNGYGPHTDYGAGADATGQRVADRALRYQSERGGPVPGAPLPGG
jgi:peptidoglycan DL-endopeptidase RipA